MALRLLTFGDLMKLSVLFVYLVIIASVLGQSAEAFYASGAGTTLRTRAVTNGSSATSMVAILHVNGDIFTTGETAVARLMFRADIGPTVVFARILKPGPSGEFEEGKSAVQYVWPELGAGGVLRGGVVNGEVHKLYSLPITDDLPNGEYVVDASIATYPQGLLVQQVFGHFFVRRTGPHGETGLKITATQTLPNQPSITINGLPQNTAVPTFVGVVGERTWSRVATTDRQGSVTFPIGADLASPDCGPSERVDIVVCVPQTKECHTFRKAVAVTTTANATYFPQ